MRERGCWINVGMPLPAGSAAQKVCAGHITNDPVAVEMDRWVENPRRGDAFLLEEARLLAEWDQVISLLWIEERHGGSSHDASDDMDDDGGIEELDGILPWPSKKRRR
jgi:hypothetical protein